MGDDGHRGIQIFPDHFMTSTSVAETPQTRTSISSTKNELEHSSSSRLWARRRLKSAASMLNFFSPRRLFGQEKMLSSTKVKSLQSELADLEEKESHSRAQLEHIGEVLRSCYLSGYLQMRTRWAALPREPMPLDDTDVDDWLPCFVVLHGSCIFLYFMSTGNTIPGRVRSGLGSNGLSPIGSAFLPYSSPQDSTLLSDIVEVGPMSCDTKEDGETLHCFYILTRYGLKYECSCTSKIQVDTSELFQNGAANVNTNEVYL